MKKICRKLIICTILIIPLLLLAQDTLKVYQVNQSKCIGCTICVRNVQCPTDAITMENGKAVIDRNKCIDCGVCAIQCPFKAIYETEIVDSISNTENLVFEIQEAKTKQEKISYEVIQDVCIGCAICARKCPAGAITMKARKAVIDSSKCDNCGICKKVCPVDAIR